MRQKLGLREMKKRATRMALSRAALKIAASEGMHAVTAERVSEQVGVSARTFHNYFPSREDAILAYAAEVTADLVELLEQRPASESLWTSLSGAFTELLCGDNDSNPQELVTLMRLLENDAGLIARKQQQVDQEVNRRIEAQYLQRSEWSSLPAMYPHLVMAMAISAARVAVERCYDPNDDRPMEVLLREAFSIAGSDFTSIQPTTSPKDS